MKKEAKIQVVKELSEDLKRVSLVVVWGFSRLHAKEMTRLRRIIREKKGTSKVVKNTLVRKALKGSELDTLAPLFEGPTGVFYTDEKNPSVISKVILDFIKEKPELTIKGGALEKRVFDKETFKALSELSTKEVLMQQFVNVLMQVPAYFIYVLNQIPQKLVSTIASLEKIKP